MGTKLRIVDEFGAPERLGSPQELVLRFPREGEGAVEKRLSQGHVRILDQDKGLIEFELTDFEKKLLRVGRAQTFIAYIESANGKTRKVEWLCALHVVANADGAKSVEIE